ncbi:T9SS type A sorting domain-containing protein [Flavobacterium sp. LPB0248]|uniref:golvesin C-terminal-like domain-containing protein n=1 Tax=Flavobacterium sp. LPB0248 TaxID=2614441 RepID=UPI0015A5B177|nr:T9SS type A sorting domain-containing protein [Flavobacterium sp. LPB0248]QLC64767.1 T9SS type A sorting domain-containing protein [Flavobacterium sp. LPB0248]
MKQRILPLTLIRYFCTLTVLAAFCAPQQLSAQPPAGYALAFEDNFEGNSLNTANWYYRAFSRPTKGYNMAENVSVETAEGTGYLRINFKGDADVDNDGAPDFTGGGIISKKPFGYGYYEARIKFYNATKGLHQSFWTHGMGKYAYSSGEDGYTESAKNDMLPTENWLSEIDGIELDSNTNFGFTNFHFNLLPCNCPTQIATKPHRNHPAEYMNLSNWITVGFEWSPGMVVYYVDGIERQRFSYTNTLFSPAEVWLTALAGYGGDLSTAPLPGAAMRVDYFRYYNKPVWGNMLGNFSFEFGKKSEEAVKNWTVNDNVYDNESTDGARVVFNGTAQEGEGYLAQDFKADGSALTVKQNLAHIPNGSYRMTAWVKRSPGSGSAHMRVLNYGSAKSAAIPAANAWTQISIDNIEISNNQITAGFTTENGTAGQSIMVDRVELLNKSFGEPAPCALIVDNVDPGYSESGSWNDSGLTGYNNTATRQSSSAGGYARWTPNIPAAGLYDAYLYRIVDSNSDGNSKLTVNYAGGEAALFINDTLTSSTRSGWVFIGTYPFEEGTAGYVQKAKSPTGATVRGDAVAFIKPGSPLSGACEDIQGRKISSQAIIVYPNPVAADSFSLSYELAEPGEASVEIYSLAGSLVSSQKFKAANSGPQQENIKFEGPPGTYIVNVRYGTKVEKTILMKN